MKKMSYLSLMVISIAFFSCKSQTQTRNQTSAIHEEDLLGYWISSFPAEYFIFEKSDSLYELRGYLHDRLIISGTYKIQSGKFIIDTEADVSIKGEFDFTLEGDTLRIFNDENSESFERIESPVVEQKSDEQVLLETLGHDLGFTSGPPEVGNFKWIFLSEEGADTLWINMVGYKISKEVIIKNKGSNLDSIKTMVCQYLIDNGFVSDSLNITKIFKGFHSDTFVAIVSTMSDSVIAENEPGYIEVQCALTDQRIFKETDVTDSGGYRIRY